MDSSGTVGDTPSSDEPTDSTVDGAARPGPRGWRPVWWLVSVLILGCLGLVLWTKLSRREPLTLDDGFGDFVLATLAGLGVVVFVSLAVWKQRWLPLSVVVLGFAVFVWAHASIHPGDLHWRWSRADFERVASGDSPDCDHDECRIGWWDVESVQRWPDIVAVELPFNTGCYAGDYLVTVTASDPGMDGIEDMIPDELRQRGFVDVSRARDDWYHVCITT